ncbi:MAG: UvrD-helicase domain-containing protein [Culturomica sp.]|jgi:ATP-dependent exoDNAse (exonuclease V) beta subunit|nr:UvrD-helicase domain-containing protein [Culturomica sp.]
MPGLKIYKASAGSGKTFTLTLEFFRIVFGMPSDFKNILAVTFTNKATGEMKSRIVRELHRLAEGKESVYGKLLRQELNLNAEQLQNRAVVLRTLLLHDYGRFSVTTIDRFFQRILKSFTRELGVYPGYNVELDTGYVLARAVERVLERVGENPALRSWIAELMTENVSEGKSWNIRGRIAALGEELFKEEYRLFDKTLLEKFGDKAFLTQYRAFLKKTVTDFETRLSETGRKAVELIEQNGLALTDFKSGKAGCAASFYKWRNGQWEEVTRTARAAVGNPEAWVTKGCSADVRERIERIWPSLNGWLEEGIAWYDAHFREYLSAKYLLNNLYQLGILNDLYGQIRFYCEEKGVMLLSDTTHLLNLLIGRNDTSFLFEKTGSYYKHLMIDEFQDTSSLQWMNFRPLLVNALSEGNKALIVGDVKQSIYRWRGGEWSLLAGGVEQDFRQLGTEQIHLPDNWRSAAEIVLFNNRFFRKASGELKNLFDGSAGAGNPWSEAISEAYAELEQQVRASSAGYVEVRFGPVKQEEESDREIMRSVVGVIEDIRERGGRLQEIALLVRNGKEGAFAAAYLMEYNRTAEQPIRFVSNDSLYVASSAAVCLIVSVLRYLADPYDEISRAEMLYGYHSLVSGSQEIPESLFTASGAPDVLARLGMDPGAMEEHTGSLYGTVEEIIARFSLGEKSRETAYLIAFQDIVYEYGKNNPDNIPLFLAWWEKEQEKRVLSASEEADALRILTIHKAKGLEFEFVVVPFCNWELDAVRPVRRIWCRNRPAYFDALETVPLDYSSKLADTIYREDYYNEHLKAYVDSLNLLYVAFTRARTELYVCPYGPKVNKDGSVTANDAGAFVFRVLQGMQPEPEGLLEKGFTAGRKQRFEGVQSLQEEEAQQAMEVAAYPVSFPGNRLRIGYKYREFTGEESGESHGGREQRAIDEGKLLHEIFRSVQRAEDVEQAVRQVYADGLLDAGAVAGYCRKVRGFMENSPASEWFASGYEVINERDILLPDGKKIRPDRVMLKAGKVCVVDYKFGRKEDGRYREQVGSYCRTLQKMGYPDVEGYIWYVRLGKVVRI